MDWLEKQRCLNDLALKDEIYCVWRKSFRSSESAFFEYVNNQPEEIRNILLKYAESGRMMQQRLVNLACMNMDFSEE